jgi:mono/diheme cytochrome c family protein
MRLLSPLFTIHRSGRRLPCQNLGALTGGLLLLAAVSHAAPSRPSPEAALAGAAHSILAKRCFQCHGASRISGLDLRTRPGAMRGGSRGPALVPGKPEESSLYQFVSGKGAAVMPPGGALPPAEQYLLRRWIAAGAPWPTEGRKGKGERRNGETPSTSPVAFPLSPSKNWAFVPLKRPKVPVVKNRQWVRSPIDAFVLSRLEARGLSPAPPADRRTLIRRLYFDLTGLPPTPEEVERFVANPSQRAYEELVDRLLASPRYGERWARHWLDVVRFSESQGFERDKIRDHAWRYRDWVIRAFNSDMSYDRFVREQIAGDVIPGATRDSITATGFLVAGPWDEVGNTQASAVMRARVREDELEDMVSAVGQTFLGLTVNCARCHDHKFDPIPQADYYRVQAALAGVRHGDRVLPPLPGEKERDAEAQRLTTRAAGVEREIAALRAAGRERAARALQAGRPPASVPAPAPVARWSFEGDARDGAGSLHAALSGGASLGSGRLRLDGRDGSARTGPLPWTLTTRTLEAWVDLATLDQRGGSLITTEDEAGRVFDGIVYGEQQPRKWTAGSNSFLRTVDLPAPEETSPPGTLVHMAVTYGADHRISVYRNGRLYAGPYLPGPNPESTLRTYAAGQSRILFGLRHSEGAQPGGGRWLKGEIEEARLYDRALSPAEVEASFRSGPPVVTEADVEAALTAEEAAARARLAAELDRSRAEIARLTRKDFAYVANPQAPPPVHLLKRGDVLQKGDPVSPAGLSGIPGLTADFGLAPDAPDAARRLKLAEWITSPANPLTPRVMANRVWQYHFGRGLVPSPSDFGANGEPPSHPELLDWLAGYFVGGNGEMGKWGNGGSDRTAISSFPRFPISSPNPWSLKSLHRLILLSSTYRQSGRFDPKAAAVDAENRLLWRRSPRRMDAEELRDAMLTVSGQLNLEEGGPGFRSFSVFVNNSHFYTYEDRTEPEYNRRSIYRAVVNSAGLPLLEAFDCPDPSVKTPRRSATTTPLQALVLLNNRFALRQAAEFARRVEGEAGPDPARQADAAYRHAFGRPPNPAEAKRASAFVKEHGLAAFCRVLLNASEFVYVR